MFTYLNTRIVYLYIKLFKTNNSRLITFGSQNLHKDNNVGIQTENRLNKWKIKELSGLT
jgi:hypothetical protein